MQITVVFYFSKRV